MNKSLRDFSDAPRSAAVCEFTYGSLAMTFISNARARRTTSCPMLPRPTTPSVFPRSSVPTYFTLPQSPLLVELAACGMERAIAIISPSVCSATETALPPGVFITRTPAAVAASTSIFSDPVPAFPITFRCGAAANNSASTLIALRTISASAWARCSRYSSGFETITFQPGWGVSSSTPAAGIASAIRMFMRRLVIQ